MWRLIVLMAVAILATTGSVRAATLNKCIDAQGRVTYSNLPCRNAQEVRKVEIDPAPQPEPARAQSHAAQQQNAQPVAEIQRTSKGSSTNTPPARSSARECDSLSSKLGSVLDKMDRAHRKGYTQEQMDKWNQEVKSLESKKQQAGCF
jgi:hypothetical protein